MIDVIIPPVMTKKLIRLFQHFSLEDIQPYLLIYGGLGGQCANCQAMDVKLDKSRCPQCETPFAYIAFRRPAEHLSKIKKLLQDRPGLRIIDYDDFKKAESAVKAERFLKD